MSGQKGNDVRTSSAKNLKGFIRIKKGTGNVIHFGKGSSFSGSIKIKGNNNTIHIGDYAKINASILVIGDNRRLSIGDHTTSVEIRILCSDQCDVTIGKWCMFSRKIEIRTTDAHSVVDRNTLTRINSPGSVNIGDHVWVGVGTLISKGVTIPADCVVGAMSFVNNSFHESGVVIAGVPAKIVKRGITWNRERKNNYTSEQLDFWKET